MGWDDTIKNGASIHVDYTKYHREWIFDAMKDTRLKVIAYPLYYTYALEEAKGLSFGGLGRAYLNGELWGTVGGLTVFMGIFFPNESE